MPNSHCPCGLVLNAALNRESSVLTKVQAGYCLGQFGSDELMRAFGYCDCPAASAFGAGVVVHAAGSGFAANWASDSDAPVLAGRCTGFA